MSQLVNNQSEELRHERKFLITDYSVGEVEQLLKYHPACFTEIYHQRQINNIYFDTLGFESYYGNVEGDTNRTKIRIRWYDDLFGTIPKSTLEFKIKKGLLGKKNSYPLAAFELNEQFSKTEIIKALNTEQVPKDVSDLVKSMQPTLLNSYVRNYYISADKNFRITVDKELTFYRISYNGNTFLNKVQDHKAVVLELKYDSQLENEAKEIGTKFPFLMTKNSKYLQGIERVLF
jgi:SPX domain protein involved in polyphosphate accumulation